MPSFLWEQPFALSVEHLFSKLRNQRSSNSPEVFHRKLLFLLKGSISSPHISRHRVFNNNPVLFRLRGLFLHRESKHMEMFAHKVLSPHSKGIRNSSDMSRRKASHNSRHRVFNNNMSHRKASHNSNHRDSNNSPHSSRHEDHSNNHVLFRQPRQPPRDLRYS